MRPLIAVGLEWLFLSITLGAIFWCYLFSRTQSSRKDFEEGLNQRMQHETSGAWLNRDWMALGYRLLSPVIRFTVNRVHNPDLLSWMTLIPGLLAGVALAGGLFWTAASLLLFAGLLDLLDGAVARYHRRVSKSGALLDSTIDRYVEFSFHAGLLIYFAHAPFAQFWIFFALMGAFLVTYSTAKGEILNIRPPRGIMKRGERVVTWILVFWGAGFLAMLNVQPGGWIAFMAALIGILSHGSAALRLQALAQRSRNP